jgi:hypothetical protein
MHATDTNDCDGWPCTWPKLNRGRSPSQCGACWSFAAFFLRARFVGRGSSMFWRGTSTVGPFQVQRFRIGKYPQALVTLNFFFLGAGSRRYFGGLPPACHDGSIGEKEHRAQQQRYPFDELRHSPRHEYIHVLKVRVGSSSTTSTTSTTHSMHVVGHTLWHVPVNHAVDALWCVILLSAAFMGTS